MPKATLSKPKRRKKPLPRPKSGFGVLVIPKDATIKHGAVVDGGEYRS